jgi:hypothetical protein
MTDREARKAAIDAAVALVVKRYRRVLERLGREGNPNG